MLKRKDLGQGDSHGEADDGNGNGVCDQVRQNGEIRNTGNRNGQLLFEAVIEVLHAIQEHNTHQPHNQGGDIGAGDVFQNSNQALHRQNMGQDLVLELGDEDVDGRGRGEATHQGLGQVNGHEAEPEQAQEELRRQGNFQKGGTTAHLDDAHQAGSCMTPVLRPETKSPNRYSRTG
ncbi:hypothetical protein JZ751_024164 [Albula glossodonta]|uniref:Uncharacterized protein n=1 Tax=Albula glossodonta TaxID=121402 RepID=A0A8T2NF34_9TELE|nr:hypothetical protein JZ751_024164 [Albula glossodonta]